MPRCPRMFGHLLPLLRRWLCSTRRQRPEHLFGTPCRIGHRNESWALPSLCRATPSATSEHLLGLLDSSPIPPSSSLLRASPSPHTARPDSREVPVDRRLHDHRWGFPCCFRSLLLACRRQYPGRSDGTCSLVLFHQRRPSLDSRRVGSCVTRFGACSAFTQVTAYMLAKSPMRPSTPEASAALLSPPPLRLLPGGANQFPGGTFTRSGPALFTAHAKVGLGYSFLPKISKPGRSKRICHVFPAFLSYALTVQGDNLSVDGSFIEANANKESRIPREQFSHRTA